MKDFTVACYRELLETLLDTGYTFFTTEQYAHAMQKDYHLPADKVVVLRHDVDLKPENSLTTATLEHTLGINATYYFRIVKESNRPDIIHRIAALGHEIGYHYEDLTLANGDISKAYLSFQSNLEYFRRFYPVSTICMHGSPRSPYDSKDIWRTYDYHALGIIAEPYFDIDFAHCFYLTDTGRCWDGYRVSVRDKIPTYQDQWTAAGLSFHSTQDVISAAKSGKLPKQLMITTHPQRWTDNNRLWWKEMISQNLKNIVKRIMILLR